MIDPDENGHAAMPSYFGPRERRAYVCSAKDCGVRIFLLPHEPDSAASCNEHGRRMMIRQENARYRGKKPR